MYSEANKLEIGAILISWDNFTLFYKSVTLIDTFYSKVVIYTLIFAPVLVHYDYLLVVFIYNYVITNTTLDEWMLHIFGSNIHFSNILPIYIVLTNLLCLYWIFVCNNTIVTIHFFPFLCFCFSFLMVLDGKILNNLRTNVWELIGDISYERVPHLSKQLLVHQFVILSSYFF